MPEIPRAALFGKLNPLTYKAIQSATTFCTLKGHPLVEVAHWLHHVFLLQDSDLHHLIRAFELDEARLAKDLNDYLGGLPVRAGTAIDFSWQVEETIAQSWVLASLLFGAGRIRSGHLIAALVKTRDLHSVLPSISTQFKKITWDRLSVDYDELLKGSPEVVTEGREAVAGVEDSMSGQSPASALMGKQEALGQFTTDLTEEARAGRIDPIIGRDEEIRQIIDILMRRRQNNPILTGEAGVGKTAVVEGFAHRLASGDVPPALQNVTLRMLDIGLLQAGASVKGEFENRLRQVIDEVQSSETPIILFIDEAHTLIGAGGAAGTGDAANLLKPALARGTLRTIAATTWSEYKKHIEKDPALTRRFQVVQIHEPDEERASRMMRSMLPIVEKHHQVLILDEALEAAVKLSKRYIPARQLPDKAVSLLDTACARVSLTQNAKPRQVEDVQRQIEALEIELKILDKEEALGISKKEGSREELVSSLAAEQQSLEKIQAVWDEEKALVEKMINVRSEIIALQTDASSDESVREALAEKRTRLEAMRTDLANSDREVPLVLPEVNAVAVASVVQDWTGIPVGRMVADEIQAVLNLDSTLRKRIIGQDQALEMIVRRIKTSRAGLENPNKPIGVFLLSGPSGVGKTETALALADVLYGGEQNMVTINMSEFQEAHTVSTLKGAPPGYVGYGEGGVLTEAVRRRPHCVVLLDEVEKAHPDVHEIFFQVFDKGIMEDAEGRVIDFKNTLILLTTNVGSELIINLYRDPGRSPDLEGLGSSLRKPLLEVFPAALLGRMVTIPYRPLNDEMMGVIIRLQLDRIVTRIHDRHAIQFDYDQEAVELIASRCHEVESGGRVIDSILTNAVLPRISEELLERQLVGDAISRIILSVKDEKYHYAFE